MTLDTLTGGGDNQARLGYNTLMRRVPGGRWTTGCRQSFAKSGKEDARWGCDDESMNDDDAMMIHHVVVVVGSRWHAASPQLEPI